APPRSLTGFCPPGRRRPRAHRGGGEECGPAPARWGQGPTTKGNGAGGPRPAPRRWAEPPPAGEEAAEQPSRVARDAACDVLRDAVRDPTGRPPPAAPSTAGRAGEPGCRRGQAGRRSSRVE